MHKQLLFLALFSLGLSVHVAGQSSPSVSIRFFAGDELLDNAKGVTVEQLKKLKVKVVPDSAFAAANPSMKYGLRYRMYFKHGTFLSQPKNGTSDLLGPAVVGDVQPGDVIMLEFELVTRTDASGKREKVELSEEMKYVSILVR